LLEHLQKQPQDVIALQCPLGKNFWVVSFILVTFFLSENYPFGLFSGSLKHLGGNFRSSLGQGD
jgi:hypothetical protein